MKHIIDTTSPDFDGIPMRLRENHQGRVLLEEDRRADGSLRGIITIGLEDLLLKTPNELGQTEGLPAQYHNQPIIVFFGDDMNADNQTGHRKNAAVFEELMDEPEARQKMDAHGFSVADIEKLKTKFRTAQQKGG